MTKAKKPSLRRHTSGLFRQYFFVTFSIILISFVLLGGALLLLVSRNWMEEKLELIKENTVSIAQNTQDVLSSDYLGDSGKGSVILICNTLLQISNAIDADIFVSDNSGKVVYCKDLLRSDMALHSGSCLVHGYYRIPPDIMAAARNGSFASTGTLGDDLPELSFIVGSPVVIDGETVGVVFATQPIVGGLSPYIIAIFRMFLFASLFAMLLAFIVVYLQSYRLTKPLRQMSEAAKQYANGDFSSRIAVQKSIWSTPDDEIAELVKAFNQMAQALATLETSRRSFVANVSHELKTPMTTIGGFIDGILDGTIDAERREQYLRIVSDEVKRLSRLVTGMLNMSKIEAGELDIKPRQFDLSEMIFRTLLGFEQFIDRKHIEIRGLDVLKPNRIMADEDMINQVVYNLVDNAVKFTPENGHIEISSERTPGASSVTIRNSGKGISSEEIAKIFERFYKVDKSRSFDVKGAGMGLFITKTIVELHGGTVRASSREGEYTEFTFTLPLGQ